MERVRVSRLRGEWWVLIRHCKRFAVINRLGDEVCVITPQNVGTFMDVVRVCKELRMLSRALRSVRPAFSRGSIIARIKNEQEVAKNKGLTNINIPQGLNF